MLMRCAVASCGVSILYGAPQMEAVTYAHRATYLNYSRVSVSFNDVQPSTKVLLPRKYSK